MDGSSRQSIESVNDFVVKFANVNGSGSASANALFAKSVLRMGIPASSRNIFPSNIQGLPTWYEVRISESGHLGRRGGVDMMVAMNPQTWDEDLAEIEPGGYLFYDSTKPLPPSKFRDDVTVIGAPLTAICNREYNDPRQRQLFKNIIYLGALSALLNMDVGGDRKADLRAVPRQGHADPVPTCARSISAANGRLNEHECPIGLRLERVDKVGDRIFITGNDAAALGAVYGGATVCAWYPITPSSSLAEAFANHCRRYRVDPETKKQRYAIIQAEDELASIGMVIGACVEWCARVYRDLGAGHLADAGIHRARLFCRDPGGDLRRAARQPVDRHADPHPAGRHPVLRPCLAWRHQARAAAPRGPARKLRLCRRGIRSGGPAADPGLCHARPRHRHERLAGRAVGMGREPAITTAAR